MPQQEINNPKGDRNWGTTLYTRMNSDTLTIQGEVYKMDSHPIICIGLEDHQMTKLEQEQVHNTKDEEGQAQTRKCIYMLNTLDPEETTKYNKLGTPEEATAFLAALVSEVEAGKRELRVYQPTKGLTAQACLGSGEILDQGIEEKIQWLGDYPPLTIKLKPRTLEDQPGATTQAVTKAEQCMPEPTRSDQAKEGSPPQDKAIIRDSLTLDETKVPEKEP